MSSEDREKWDQRYREGAYADRNYPSEFLRKQVSLVNTGRAMDLACGVGRNAIYLSELGYQVDAIDVSSEGLEIARERARERGVSINWINEDLLNGWSVPDGQYDLIVMFRFVSRDILVKLPKFLAPGGTLIVEEHLQWPQGNVTGPTNNRFRVKPGELIEACQELDVLFNYEGLIDEPDGSLAALAQIHSKKPNQ